MKRFISVGLVLAMTGICCAALVTQITVERDALSEQQWNIYQPTQANDYYRWQLRTSISESVAYDYTIPCIANVVRGYVYAGARVRVQDEDVAVGSMTESVFANYQGGDAADGTTITKAETDTDTTWDAATGTVMTGTGSTWKTSGATLVATYDDIQITGGTHVVQGFYNIASITNNTTMTLRESIDDVPGDGDAPSGVSYTLFRRTGRQGYDYAIASLATATRTYNEPEAITATHARVWFYTQAGYSSEADIVCKDSGGATLSTTVVTTGYRTEAAIEPCSWIALPAGTVSITVAQHQEAWSDTHGAYALGETIIGSDSKIYVCKLATPSSDPALYKPITGTNYTTYWNGATNSASGIFYFCGVDWIDTNTIVAPDTAGSMMMDGLGGNTKAVACNDGYGSSFSGEAIEPAIYWAVSGGAYSTTSTIGGLAHRGLRKHLGTVTWTSQSGTDAIATNDIMSGAYATYKGQKEKVDFLVMTVTGARAYETASTYATPAGTYNERLSFDVAGCFVYSKVTTTIDMDLFKAYTIQLRMAPTTKYVYFGGDPTRYTIGSSTIYSQIDSLSWACLGGTNNTIYQVITQDPALNNYYANAPGVYGPRVFADGTNSPKIYAMSYDYESFTPDTPDDLDTGEYVEASFRINLLNEGTGTNFGIGTSAGKSTPFSGAVYGN